MSSTNYPHLYLAEDTGHILIAVSVLFIILDTIFLALRFYAGKLHKTSVGVDDFVISLAWCTHVGLCILGIIMVQRAGVGRHLAYNMQEDPHIVVAWVKSLYALEWLYLPSCALPKISVILLYIRIFASRTERLVSYVVMWMLAANWFAYLIACSLQCRPFEYMWNKKIPGGKCINVPLLYKLSSIGNIITDVIIFILPLKVIIGLHATTARKLGLLFIFCAGSVGIVASVIRMVAFFQTDAFEDNTWASVKLVSWSIVEPGMYIIAACSLKLRPVTRKMAFKLQLKKLYRSILGKTTQGSDSKNGLHLGPMRSSSGFRKMSPGQAEDTLLEDKTLHRESVPNPEIQNEFSCVEPYYSKKSSC